MINRYSREKMRSLWTDEYKLEKFLSVELLSLEAFENLGVIPKDDIKLIKENAALNIERVRELEEITKHDVIAFTRAVGETLGEEKKWLHYGLTSTDVVDTAMSAILKEVNLILVQDLRLILATLKKKALQYQNIPCIGRTHGVHAEITSFGLKFALWYDEMNRNLNRFLQSSKEIEVGKISGAVGNFAHIPTYVQDYICEKLGLTSSNISTQTLQRDRHANYMSVIALIGTSLEKIATEIRHLQRTEVREVEEYFGIGQKGSSAMPHKRNPIGSENIAGCSRVLRGYMMSAFENVSLWHERDISHSSVERIILPDATILLDYMLTRMNKILNDLTVFEDQMLKNIYCTHGIIFSQRVMNLLIKKDYTRENAYDFIQPISMESWQQGKNFKTLLEKNKIFMSVVNQEELEECFSLDYYLKAVSEIYKRVGIL